MILEDIKSWPEKLRLGQKLATGFCNQHKDSLPSTINNVAFCGMGGSGIAGRIVKAFLDSNTNIQSQVITAPDLPQNMNPDTLAFVSSYSGNTWETISVLKQLLKRSIPVIVLAHGGQAEKIAQEYKLPFLKLPEFHMPRSALSVFLGFLLTFFEHHKLLPGATWIDAFAAHASQYIPQFSEKKLFGDFISLAQDLPFFHVWGISNDSAAFAFRAQTQFNENSKMQAVYSEFPELCHNLLVGFTQINAKTLVVMFHSSFLSENLKKAIQATGEILQEKGANLYKVPILGDTFEVQLFNMILWADFASCHVGQSRGVQLTPVRIIDSLKQAHKNKGITV